MMTVMSGCAGEPVASITVTWVMARLVLGGWEQEISGASATRRKTDHLRRQPRGEQIEVGKRRQVRRKGAMYRALTEIDVE
jgi:hypothetical protein